MPTNLPAPAPMPFIPGSFIKLPDGTLRPLTQEEKDRPEIDWPYTAEFPYNRYRRRCIHCKGELWGRLLGHSTTQSKSGKCHRADFGIIVCDNECQDPVRFTPRELKGLEWYEANSQRVYYTPEEIAEWDAYLEEIEERRKESSHETK